MSGLDFSVVGKKNPEKILKYNSKDVILYALGIGAQTSELSFIYEGASGGLKVFPSYATVLRYSVFPHLGNISFPKFIHGEELVRLYKPFNPQGEVICFSEVTSIYDKIKAAVINVKTTGLSNDRSPLFEIESSFFYLGAGGFGGERGPKTEPITPPEDRSPDFSVTYKTAENQAALYRLSGDLNPLHIDPKAARFGGQEKPILHGLCTYGFATRAILYSVCDGDISRFKEFKVRFTNVVYPGESLTTEGWKVNGKYIIQVKTDRAIVLSNAYAIIG
ncbi:MAG: MaoC family dehydratase [Candidatus Lokiarchaeota archaeon]|nr:MaoC family dehydratase [Candidatus Lokiarchaeota archaeon]